MIKGVRTFISMMLVLLPLAALASRGRLLTMRHGLSSSYVNQVMQDSRGFVWIATRGGLNRYDGTRMRTWHRGTLPSDNVTCLVEDADGRLLAGTVSGAVAYSHTSGSITPIITLAGNDTVNLHILSLLRLDNGDVLMSTSGYGLYMLPRGSSVARHSGIYFEGGDNVRYSTLAPDGTIWLAGSRGVFSIDRQRRVKTYLDQDVVGDCCIASTSAGQVVVGTTARGLFVYDALIDRFVQQPSSSSLNIVSLLTLDNGTVVAGTNGNGAYMLNRGATAVEPCPFRHDQVDMSRVNVHCMMQDRDGTLWMGLYQSGLFVQPLGTSGAYGFSDLKGQSRADIKPCMALCTDRDGTVWVGTDGDGLYHIDAQSGSVLRHYAAGNGGVPETLMAITVDETGRLWIGSWQQGGGWLNRATGEFHRLPFTTSGGAVNVMGLASDGKGGLWISTGGSGLMRYDVATGNVEHHVVAAGATPKTNTLPNAWPSQLTFSSDRRLLYIAMSVGLACYDTKRHSFVSQFGSNHVLSDKVVNTVIMDKRGTLWVGTDCGLMNCDAHGKLIGEYTTANGLPHDNVCSLQFDEQGQLWIGTMNGLACKKGDMFTCYYASDGLQEGEWSERAACATAGLVVMGGVGGLSVVNPEAMVQVGRDVPTLQLVEALMDGQSVPPNMSFDMSHNAGSLSLRFSSMIYDRPDAVSYRYSINGADYVPLPTSDGVLTLSNLASGKYTIRVKSVVGGVESEPLTLELKVHPPFYSSWIAFLLYAAVAILVIWRVVAVRRERERQQRALQEHIRAEEMKEMKLQFFMSLNHEIRTPMSLIAAPLQQLIESDTYEPRLRLYNIMQNASQRILTIINQILDLRKIDRGLLQMRMRPTNIVAMTRDVCALFEAKAAEHHIDMRIDDRTNGCEVWVDASHFDKVIMNLLSNAFKFAPDGGNVVVTLERSDTECILSVMDDGRSIEPDNLNRVFERFFQEDNSINKATAGTGIGLNLARQLVQLHHGSIEVKAAEGSTGCTFVVTLPLGCEHLSESEKDNTPADAPIQTEVSEDVHDVKQEGNTAQKASTRATVLVVEDDEEIRNYLTRELEGTYRIVACADGRQGLSEALRQPPALVLSDVMMPVMDGYTLCARLKSNSITNFVPVVLLTAKTRESDKLEGLGHGADAYIEKPFNIAIVKHTIRNLIAAHNLLRNKLSGNELPLERIDEVRIATPDEQLIERITRVVNAHIDDPHLSVEQIADEVGISRAHLHRKMKELTNQGPRDWVRNLRLERAAQLLRQGHHNISQVMYACGFDNLSSFSTKFKARFGVSPSAYMQDNNK